MNESFKTGFEKVASTPNRTGTPKTDKERLKAHKEKFGNEDVPAKRKGRSGKGSFRGLRRGKC